MTVPVLDSSDVVRWLYGRLSTDTPLATLLSGGSGIQKIRHARIQVPTSNPQVAFFVASERASEESLGIVALIQVDSYVRAIPRDAGDPADPELRVRDIRRRVREIVLGDDQSPKRIVLRTTPKASLSEVRHDFGISLDTEADGEWMRASDQYRFSFGRQ